MTELQGSMRAGGALTGRLGGLEAVQEGNDTFNVWLRKLKAIDRELYGLYQTRDFQGMVEAVVNLPDPGN